MDPFSRWTDRCRGVVLLLADVDGVMTDGRLAFDNQGMESKAFHIRDGLGIKLWQRAGHRFGLVSGRSSHIVKLRASELGVEIVRQGFEDKWPVVAEILAQLGLAAEQAAFIGDDLPDLAVLQRVGFAAAVADAAAEVREAAHFVTQARGGRGAVRELVELMLKAQDRWQNLLARFHAP